MSPLVFKHTLFDKTNHVMKELNQLDFAGPLTTEAMLAVSKNIFEGKMLVNVADYYMLKSLAIDAS